MNRPAFALLILTLTIAGCTGDDQPLDRGNDTRDGNGQDAGMDPGIDQVEDALGDSQEEWQDDLGPETQDDALPDGLDLDDAASDSALDQEETCTEENLWWIWDLSVMPPQDTQICAFVRGEGEHVVVVVEQSTWGLTVDEPAVVNLIAAWDESTPADPELGLYDLTAGLFGQPPDAFDDDPRIYLLLYEMEGFRGFTFDGYFRVDDQADRATSNRREMLHINTRENPVDSDYMLSVQAHEFQHLIHWNYDLDEDSWLNEAMSELAMVVTGFGADEGWVSSWLDDPSDPIMPDAYSVNYGILLLFGTYLYERFGPAFIADLVSDRSNGVRSFDSVLQDHSPGSDFASVLADFGLAVALDEPDFEDGRFGLELLDFDPVRANNLTLGGPSTTTVSGDGGLGFFRSTEDLDGLAVELESAGWEELSVRVAVISPDGPALVAEELSGENTQIPLSSVAGEGVVLWITVGNPSALDSRISVRLE